MHTDQVLQKFLRDSLASVHLSRLRSLVAAVDAVVHGAHVAITSMGRQLKSGIRIKHQIKRMDRLIGNLHLYNERLSYYRVMTQCLLKSTQEPLILIDWSDFSKDGAQQLLRASVPIGGRAVTLYEQIHRHKKLGNRKVQHQFLKQLKSIVPDHCVPVIIADSGFRTPFFRQVESLGWHWLGRIRNRDFVCWEGQSKQWFAAKDLYSRAKTTAKRLGNVSWVRYKPLSAFLVLVRQRKCGRQSSTLKGLSRNSSTSKKIAQRQREPWLLVASLSLESYSAKQIMSMYKSRMQIEENFRDTKSIPYGLGIARESRTSIRRACNLLLIAALSIFLLWLIGALAKERKWDRHVRVNSSSKRDPYSVIFLARLLLKHTRVPLSSRCLNQAHQRVDSYMKVVVNVS